MRKQYYCVIADGQHIICEKVRHFKETEKGVDTMCDILDEMKNDVRVENALEMIALGKLSLEEISKCSGLSLEKVRELAGNKSA